MAYAWENSKTLNESSATVIRTKDIIKNLYDQLSTKEEFKNVSFDTFIALYNYYVKDNDVDWKDRASIKAEDMYDYFTSNGTCTLVDFLFDEGIAPGIMTWIEIGKYDEHLIDVIKKMFIQTKILTPDGYDNTIPEDEGDKYHKARYKKPTNQEIITWYLRDRLEGSDIDDCIDLLAAAYYSDNFDYSKVKPAFSLHEDAKDSETETTSKDDMLTDLMTKNWDIINSLNMLKDSGYLSEDDTKIVESILDSTMINIGMLTALSEDIDNNTRLLDLGKKRASEITDK